MKKYRIYQIDAFTSERFRGNPAGVVTNADGLTDAQMQGIARELNNSETAFILSPTTFDHDVWVRFFTPTVEVPLCGHATIAAHLARALENGLPSCTVVQKTGIGVLPVEIIREGDDYRIVMTQGKIEFFTPYDGGERAEIVAALGLSERDLDARCPVQVVSTGHSKVLVGVNSRDVLDSLKPDMARLVHLSQATRCNGYFAFVLASDADEVLTHGRMFAPAIGVLEDPVTGNANGPLGAYLVEHRLVEVHDDVLRFKARQGEAIGRAGAVDVEVTVEGGHPIRVRVGGRGVVVFRTDIDV